MGWGPCLAYTAPLLLPYIGATKTSWRAGLRIGLMFSLGRIAALAILGALATVAFKSINRFFPPHRSSYLYLVTALFVVILGILIVLGKGFRVPLHKKRYTPKPSNDLSDLNDFNGFNDYSGTESMLFLGFLIGISPCAPLVAVLTYIACVAENIASGILYAVSFGIGAAFPPIVLGALVGILPERIFRTAKLRRIFQVVCGVVLILFGLQLVYYVLNLL
jgi:sulfite exporter TauE/SafE